MPLFTNVNLGVPKPLDLENYQATFGESLSASFEMGLEANPMSILTRSQKMSGLDGFDLGDSQLPLDAREIIDVEDFAADYAQKALSLEDQARQIKEAGLEGQLKPVEGYRQEALDIVMENKRMENVISAMNPGLGASLLGGLAAGFLDPINLASAFVPVVGEARMMSLMSAAKGIGQRALIRGGIGAASGMVGSALLEPIIYLGQQEIQADYTLANSLQNLAFGAVVMGGAMHTGLGTFAEWRRAKSGKPQPWEYVPPDFTTEEWKNAHAADLYRYQMEATPEADPVDVRQWAEDTAATFDARARNWAYHEKKTVKEFYDQWRPEYRTWQDDSIWREAMPSELRGNPADYDGGDLGWIGRQYEGLRTLDADAMALPEFLDNLALWEERFPDLHDYAGIRQKIEDARAGIVVAEDTLLHGRYRNKAKTVHEFLDKYDELIERKAKTYFDFDKRKISRQDRIANDYEIWLPIDQVTHIKNRHPDFVDWEKIPSTIDKGEIEKLGINYTTGGETYLFKLPDGDKLIAVIGAPIISKNKGNRIVILTAFKNSKAGIENWAARFKKEAASSQGSGGSPGYPSSQRNVLLGSENGKENIIGKEGEVNLNPTETLYQSTPSLIGKKTQILGANSKEIARYELRELEDVIPSHDPENSFRKRPDYPEIAQERPYHSDDDEQQKVIGNALGYEPGFVISTDASATNGPPIITKDGIVLGGNSRAMTLQLVYGGHFPEKAAAYRQALVDNAAQFGIDPQAVASMKKPMLVRVISGDLTPEQMAKRSREYNQTTTQTLQGENFERGDILYQLEENAPQAPNPLPERFADLPFVEADPAKYFGAGKEISTDGGITRGNLVAWAKSKFGSGQTFINDDTGWSSIVSVKSIRNTVNHGLNEAKAISVPYIPEIIKTGIYITSKDKTNRLKSHFFANKMQIDGKEYVVGFIIREDVNGKRFYDHEMTEIIDPDSLKHAQYTSNEVHRVSGNRANQGQIINILREHLGVNDGTGKILFQKSSFNDPDTLLPPELQENPRITARGSVRFNAEDRPIVTFFQSANFSTAPHELFHIFRREMERTALSADGSLHSKEQWKRLCDYVGAKPDGEWTVEMEEKFANAGLRYLAEGRAPSPSLQGIFERLKAWFMELFQRAEEIGAEISPEMRKAFDEMFSVPYETADANFRRSMGDLHSREVEQEFADPDTIGKPLSPDDQRLAENTGDLNMVEELTQEAQIRADEAAARLEQNNPELRQAIDETNAEIAEIDKEIGKIGERDELRRQAVECLVNGG